MQKYRFSNPASSVVEVSKSPLAVREPGNRYTIFDCLCRPLGRKQGPRKKYQVTAITPAAAARIAIENYRKDYGQEIK